VRNHPFGYPILLAVIAGMLVFAGCGNGPSEGISDEVAPETVAHTLEKTLHHRGATLRNARCVADGHGRFSCTGIDGSGHSSPVFAVTVSADAKRVGFRVPSGYQP
jgi:hypothetical protein